MGVMMDRRKTGRMNRRNGWMRDVEFIGGVITPIVRPLPGDKPKRSRRRRRQRFGLYVARWEDAIRLMRMDGCLGRCGVNDNNAAAAETDVFVLITTSPRGDEMR